MDARSTLRRWYDEGMRRRFVIDRDTVTRLDIPLLVAIVAAVLAPWLAVAAVVVAVVSHHSVRVVTPEGTPPAAPAPANPAPVEESSPPGGPAPLD